jgi:hypothetical protein
MESQKCSRCKMDRPHEEWSASRWGRSGTWCRSCHREWHRSRYETEGTRAGEMPRPCARCNLNYLPKQRRPSIYCSRTCKDAAKNAASAARRVLTKPDRNCVWCSATMPKTMRADAKFCSEQCNSRAHQAVRRIWREAGIPKGDIPFASRMELAQRDGLVCHLCGEKLSLATKHPEPMYASIDHVLPLARGGRNELPNLKLAHLVCNLRKQDQFGG